MADYVPDGQSWDETLALATEVEASGASLINSGFGWHEARVPTIATMVPRAAVAGGTARLRPHVSLPLVTTNRINDPGVAERILASGGADMVSMARPLLADPEFVRKCAEGRADEINTCIACNQACLDHVFENKTATCLVNPRAARETELNYRPAARRRRIAVVGAGPAGLTCATVAAERGHDVVLFERAAELGGQFNMARRIPGKEEFNETLRYYRRRLALMRVDVRLGAAATVESLVRGFDAVVLATGVSPRRPSIPGLDHPKVLSYVDVLLHDAPVGRRVALIGAGGIGFDVAEFLGHPQDIRPSLDVDDFLVEWGIDRQLAGRGGLAGGPLPQGASPREIWLLQRKVSKPGAGLGKAPGWIHRTTLKRRGVHMLAGVTYERIDDAGLHITNGSERRVLAVDNVVICAGQEPQRALAAPLAERGVEVHLIGGADVAVELDAKRAIDQGARLAAAL